MDWAGIAVERVTQSKLGDYAKKHIFDPLGIDSLSFSPPEDMKNRIPGIWHRAASGKLEPRPYPLAKALEEDAVSDRFHSGGAGLWGTVRDYGSE
jgi:CubicO group peptidase (beta-lactamase class C family)